MDQPQTSSPPDILEFLYKALYEQHIKAAGVLEALAQHAEQVLALCEQYPDNESLHQLLETVRAHLVAASNKKDIQRTVLTRLQLLDTP
jgi:hypothetical protein